MFLFINYEDLGKSTIPSTVKGDILKSDLLIVFKISSWLKFYGQLNLIFLTIFLLLWFYHLTIWLKFILETTLKLTSPKLHTNMLREWAVLMMNRKKINYSEPT